MKSTLIRKVPTYTIYSPGLRVGSHGTTKIVPWDKNFFNCPMGWDDTFLKGIPSHGMRSKNFFVP